MGALRGKNEGREQIFTNFRRNSEPIRLKFGDTWAVIPFSALDHPKADRLLEEQKMGFLDENSLKQGCFLL